MTLLDIENQKQLWQIQDSVKSHRSWNKLFGIGCNKTGTSSLERIAMIFGLSCDQKRMEAESSLQAMHGNYKPFTKTMATLDFHQDMPISQGLTYVAADALFPGSKFILTVRDPEEWYQSFATYYFGHVDMFVGQSMRGTQNEIPTMVGNSSDWLFPGYCDAWFRHYYLPAIYHRGLQGNQSQSHLDKNHILGVYTARNEQICAYFHRRPRDLLILDLTKEKDISKIRDFLELPQWCNFAMPHRRPGE